MIYIYSSRVNKYIKRLNPYIDIIEHPFYYNIRVYEKEYLVKAEFKIFFLAIRKVNSLKYRRKKTRLLKVLVITAKFHCIQHYSALLEIHLFHYIIYIRHNTSKYSLYI